MEEIIHSQSHCENCQTELEGQYCHKCGQRKINFKTDWGGMCHDFISSLTHLDGKLLRGFFFLAFNPGRLTKSFLQGKRVSQIPPLRSYLLISLLFFLTISLNTNDSVQQYVDKITDEITIDSQTDNDWQDWIMARVKNADAIIHTFYNWLPKAYLFGVLVLALILRIILFRHHLKYIEHLIVALNLQSFLFLWILVVNGWSLLIKMINPEVAHTITNLLYIWLFICPFIALKIIFETSIRKTIVLTLFIQGTYFFYILFSMIGVAALSFYFM